MITLSNNNNATQNNQGKKLLNDKYEKIIKVGEGSGGKVILCKVVDKESQEQQSEDKYLVLKRFDLSSNPDFKKYGLRPDHIHEIRFMKQFDHPNVVKLVDVFFKKKSYGDNYNLYIAMDFFLDLKDLESAKLGLQEKKCIAKQFLQGISHIHKNWVIHRDIKPSNTFLSPDGTVILGDFGLARTYGSPNRQMSGNVVTKQYRPPEILYGAKIYQDKVDIWSLGVSIAELFIEWPSTTHEYERCLFNGVSEIDQLQKIFSIRGNPNETNWPGCSKLPLFMEFEDCQPVSLKEVIPKLPDDGVDIIEKMLSLDPNQRPTAEECLEHPFFKTALDAEQTQLAKIASQLHQEKLTKCLGKKK